MLEKVDRRDLECDKPYFYKEGTTYTLYVIQYSSYHNRYFAYHVERNGGPPVPFENMTNGTWYGPVNVVEK